ncbi:MAG: phosphorylase family protein [Rhodospirillales bacterium]
MLRVGFIVGLASESRLLQGLPGLAVACSGASAERARTLTAQLLDAGCAALVSFGLAGGLDPALPSGALCLPGAVLTPAGTRLPVDTDWRERLLARIGGMQDPSPLLMGRDEPVATPEQKRELFALTGAAAIDMESHAVAEVAARRDVPFLVIRAIADPADRRLPPWLGSVIGADGRPLPAALLGGLARNPADLVALIRLAGDSRRGLRTLRGVAAGAGTLLAFRM